MRYLVVTDDSTAEELREAVVNLRARQKRCVIASTRDELNEDINELLDLLKDRAACAS